MKLQAEIGDMLPQEKETKSHQNLKEVRKKSLLEPSEGAWPSQYCDFGLYSLQTWERINFCCFDRTGLWLFIMATLRNKYTSE